MRTTLLRLAAALAIAGSTAAAHPLDPEARRDTPLDVWMYCEYGYCEAHASGGSGSYTFTWNNAYELSGDWGSISSAEPYTTSYQISVSVTVTDSNNSTDSASRWYCACWW